MTSPHPNGIESFDLNDIKIFVAIAEAHTLSSAARRLNMPTSTISRAITRLEKQLGVILAQRSARGFTITDVGKGYLNACRKALRALNEGSEWIEEQRTRPSGVLKVACPVTFARDILAPLLKEFSSRFPDLKIELDVQPSGCEIFTDDRIDVLFRVRKPQDSARRIRTYPGHALGLYASNEYVQSHGAPTTPAELSNHICVGGGSWRLRQNEQVESPQLAFAVETFDPGVHLTLVLSGMGIGKLPLWMVHTPEVQDKLVPVLPDWKLDPLIMCALFFGPTAQTPKVRALLDFLDEFIGTQKDPRLRQKWSRDLFPQAAQQK